MNSPKTVAAIGDLNNAVKAAANVTVDAKSFVKACVAITKQTAKVQSLLAKDAAAEKAARAKLAEKKAAAKAAKAAAKPAAKPAVKPVAKTSKPVKKVSKK